MQRYPNKVRNHGAKTRRFATHMHKLRLAIDTTRAEMKLAGDVEIDGAYYGGHVRPPNAGREGRRPDAKTARRRKKCVLTMVRRGGSTVTRVISSENTEETLDAAKDHVLSGSQIFADEHGAYDALHARYKVFRINHRLSYSQDGVKTNQAESFHDRMRRAERGQYHRLSAHYLHRYACEIAWRSDRRRVDNGAMFSELVEMAASHPMSRDFKGYWQRRN